MTHETQTAAVLVVDDHPQARESMADILRHAGHAVDCCASALEALARLKHHEYDVILSDLCMPGMSGLEFIKSLAESNCESQVALITAHGSVQTAVEAMRYGAYDYIEKPFRVDQLEELVARALRDAALGGRRSSVPSAAPADMPLLVGESTGMRKLRSAIAQVARTEETVLITGESGTGKELVARSLHLASRRAGQTLVSLNCPALSPQLMESELFGHERGAFTSAEAPRVGRFELADKGTLLLDEVTEIAVHLQAKLLRVLQERSFERVGSSRSQTCDVRVIASTNRDLHEEVEQGRFREDLYFRLAVVPIAVPALRERREDIPRLAAHFAAKAAERLGCDPVWLDHSAESLLLEYHWPGNVRELENLMTRASVMAGGRGVRAEELRGWLIGGSAPGTIESEEAIRAGMSLQEMERRLIETTLEHYEGHREKAAQALGIGVRTLTNKLRSYGYPPRTRAFAKAG